MILYTDTSALVKLVWEEAGSSVMERTAAGADAIISAALAYVEMRSAAAVALRVGRFPAANRDGITEAVERVWRHVAEIPLDRELLRTAGDLAETHRLRGYDAVHLAALIATGGPEEVTVACWDQELATAAAGLGYSVIPSSGA